MLGIPSWKEERCVRWSMMRRSVENRKKKKGKKSSCLARVDGSPQRQDDDDHHGDFEATPWHTRVDQVFWTRRKKSIDVIYAHDLWFESRLSFFANSLFDAWMVLLGDKFLEWRYQEEG